MDSIDIRLPLDSGDQLYAKYFPSPESEFVVIGIHGSIENGRIFYPRRGANIAKYFQENQIPFYAWDLRGRGKSTPAIDVNSTFTQHDEIVTDLPAIFRFVEARHPESKIVWLTHSWGGILVNSCLLRFPEILKSTSSIVHFGTKRRVRVLNFSRIYVLEFGWKMYARYLVKKYGYLPAKKAKMGSDNESASTYSDCVEWVSSDKWIDPTDGFNYAEAAQSTMLPKTLYISGEKDAVLGHQSDVKRFALESGIDNADFLHLSKKTGFKHNYGHITMLTHPDLHTDVFPKVLAWIKQFSHSSKQKRF